MLVLSRQKSVAVGIAKTGKTLTAGFQRAIFLPAPKTSMSSVLSADAGCLFAPTLMYCISTKLSGAMVGGICLASILRPDTCETFKSIAFGGQQAGIRARHGFLEIRCLDRWN